jgi:hypothetical protein
MEHAGRARRERTGWQSRGAAGSRPARYPTCVVALKFARDATRANLALCSGASAMNLTRVARRIMEAGSFAAEPYFVGIVTELVTTPPNAPMSSSVALATLL